MNSFELFLLLTLCASVVVGPLLGYRQGRRERRDTRRWIHLHGYAKGYEAAERKYEGDPVTREMPVVSVTVNGDEVDLSPKRARDVGRSE
jgi:hypothetical protein